jgi:hypothetical protein
MTPLRHPQCERASNIVNVKLLGIWTPVCSINMLIFALQSLFLEPDLDNPLDPECATLLIRDPESFRQNMVQFMAATQPAIGNSSHEYVTAAITRSGDNTSVKRSRGEVDVPMIKRHVPAMARTADMASDCDDDDCDGGQGWTDDGTMDSNEEATHPAAAAAASSGPSSSSTHWHPDPYPSPPSQMSSHSVLYDPTPDNTPGCTISEIIMPLFQDRMHSNLSALTAVTSEPKAAPMESSLWSQAPAHTGADGLPPVMAPAVRQPSLDDEVNEATPPAITTPLGWSTHMTQLSLASLRMDEK